ncbi:MAG: RHS repeat-associated core domain-containing protein, partial [Anaerolineales bacterium]
ADRLASFTRAGTQRGEYIYNARGQLVIRTVTNSGSLNGTTVYFYDLEGRVIAEYDAATSDLIREYVWLGDRPIAVIDPDGSGGDNVYYVHSDHLNRPLAMTDENKDVVAEFTWLPFGQLFAYSGSVDLDLRFPGQIFQAESGLYYNWHRQYDPTIGRYTQPDPLGLVDGPSRYAYVRNDPLQSIDPFGLQSGLGENPFIGVG